MPTFNFTKLNSYKALPYWIGVKDSVVSQTNLQEKERA